MLLEIKSDEEAKKKQRNGSIEKATLYLLDAECEI
jgi:hypothetical protein